MANVKRLLPLAFCWLFLLPTTNSLAAETETKRPKIGLVLPGGGSHGLAHIGVIKQLERLNVPIDYISGTSMGALIGGLYASGLSTREIENFVTHVNWDQTFVDENSRHFLSFRRKQDQFHYFVKGEFGLNDGYFKLPSGLLLGQQQATLLKGMTLPVSNIHDFDKLPIPFRAVATDARTGEEVVLKSGDLAQALRASMSVPGIFAPVKIDDRYLVDGGVTNNTPVNVVRNMGADIVIVSDTHTQTPEDEAMDSYLSITSQIISSMITANSLRQLATLKPGDVLIRPIIPETLSATDFSHPRELIQIGSEAALAKTDQLKTLSDPSYHIPSNQRTWGVIDDIKIINTTHLSDDVIRHYIHQQVDQPIDRIQLETDITTLYGLGFFELITYEINREDDRNVLTVKTTPPSWGPNFFKLKLNLASNLDDSNVFNIGLRHTYSPANGLGGEWRNEINIGQTQRLKTAFYQPLDTGQQLYIQPAFEAKSRIYDINDQNSIASAQLEQQTLTPSLEMGYNFNLNLRTYVGYDWEAGELVLGKNASSQQKETYDDNIVYIGLKYDSLDQVAFPRKGTLLDLSYHNTLYNIDKAGKVQEYKSFLSSYFSYGRHTVNFHFEATDLQADQADDIHNFYTLGGFQRLSGYAEDDLIGNKVIFARLKYLYRMSSSSNPLNFPYYLGATLEAGNIYDEENITGVDTSDVTWANTKQAGSIFIGMNSFIGPIYFAYGYHDEEHQSLYFYFGHSFN
jgi:NTE family protein